MSPGGARSEPAAPALPARASGRLGNVLLCLVAASWVMAFAPAPVALVALPGIVATLELIERCRKTRQAAGYVLLFGAIAIGFGYRWLGPTVRTFGELDERVGFWALPLSWLVLAAYGVAATIHIVLFAAVHRAMVRGPRRPHPLATVALFVACETLPIRFLPWYAGYGAVDVAPLRQLAEVGGVAAISFGILCLTLPFHEWLRWAFVRSGAPARARAALATFLVGVALYGAGAWRLSVVAGEERAATTHVRVGIVQANVGSTAKRAAERREADESRENRAAYERGTRKAAERGAELIVWPETALVEGMQLYDAPAGRFRPTPQIDRDLARVGYPWIAEVGRSHAMILGGYSDEEEPPQAGTAVRTRRRYNVAVLRDVNGDAWGIYRKVKLMPFGEAMPGAGLVPSLNDLLPQTVRTSPGSPEQPLLRWKSRDLSICAFICYDAIVPDLVAKLCGDERPDLLVNLTNDSWYGDSWEPDQHLNFARVRAVEHRVPLVRATNTGVSAVVLSTGEVVARLPWGAEDVLTYDVPILARPRTVFARIAAYVAPFTWLVGLVVAVAGVRRARRGVRAVSASTGAPR